MGINVKHPILMLFIWLFMGWLGYEYGIEKVDQWIIFCIGATGAYTLIAKYY